MRALLAILIISFLAVGCTDSDLDRLESFAGVKLPSRIEFISQEDDWVSPNGEGHSVRVYEVPRGALWGEARKCELSGFKKELVRDMKVRFSILETHINHELPVCYKSELNTQSEEVVFIQEGVIIYYWAE